MPSAQPSSPPPTYVGGHAKARPRITHPLTYSGSLDAYEHSDSTVSIGREFPNLQIKKLLSSPDRDTLIRDLAITVSERGVVFLRNQDVTTKELLTLGERLSTLTGSPESSGLHIHPITESGSELGDQISVISSVKQKKATQPQVDPVTEPGKLASNGWHADITFEPVPSDYAILKIHTLPPTGGDTVCQPFHPSPISLSYLYSFLCWALRDKMKEQEELTLMVIVVGVRIRDL